MNKIVIVITMLIIGLVTLNCDGSTILQGSQEDSGSIQTLVYEEYWPQGTTETWNFEVPRLPLTVTVWASLNDGIWQFVQSASPSISYEEETYYNEEDSSLSITLYKKHYDRDYKLRCVVLYE